MGLTTDYSKRNINEMVLLFRNGQINLEPGFQRKSVWTINDRRRLIQSILSEYPLPNVFLYRRSSNGKIVYDVIDGKQRLETILMFMGIKSFKRDAFELKLDLDQDGLIWWDWAAIKRYSPLVRHRFEGFPLQTVEVSGDLSEIVDLFVRINSTGKRLTSGERRHAQFYNSQFLKEASRLVHYQEKYLLDNRIFSRGQIDRMKGTELFSELLMSIHGGGPLPKKRALDRAMANLDINKHTLGKVVREFTKTINLIKRMFPELRQTRFVNTAEFYTLFMVIWEMDHNKAVLNDRKRNAMAFELLRMLSTGVDSLRQSYKQAKSAKPRAPYSDYMLTISGSTDDYNMRVRRAKIIKSLIGPIFEKKDNKRIFSTEQRRVLWNSDVNKKCSGCRRNLSWNDFTVDHVKSHTTGGKTNLENAQLMCRSCNSSKGGR